MQNATAAQAVVQTAAADPTTLSQADGIVKAVQSKLLLNTLTGNLNVKGLAARPHCPGVLCAPAGGCVSCLRPSVDCSEPPSSTCRPGGFYAPSWDARPTCSIFCAPTDGRLPSFGLLCSQPS